jgi:hypothetical protein
MKKKKEVDKELTRKLVETKEIETKQKRKTHS